MDIKEVKYDDINTYSNEEAVCPYCGYKCELTGEDYGGQDEESEMDCFECGKTFIYTTDYSVTFSTEPYENWILSKIKNCKGHIRNLKDDMDKAPIDRREGLNKDYFKYCIDVHEKELEEFKNKAKRVLEIN